MKKISLFTILICIGNTNKQPIQYDKHQQHNIKPDSSRTDSKTTKVHTATIQDKQQPEQDSAHTTQYHTASYIDTVPINTDPEQNGTDSTSDTSKYTHTTKPESETIPDNALFEQLDYPKVYKSPKDINEKRLSHYSIKTNPNAENEYQYEDFLYKVTYELETDPEVDFDYYVDFDYSYSDQTQVLYTIKQKQKKSYFALRNTYLQARPGLFVISIFATVFSIYYYIYSQHQVNKTIQKTVSTYGSFDTNKITDVFTKKGSAAAAHAETLQNPTSDTSQIIYTKQYQVLTTKNIPSSSNPLEPRAITLNKVTAQLYASTSVLYTYI